MNKQVASRLLDSVGAPKSVASAVVVLAPDGARVIRVYFDASRFSPARIPSVFEGFKVEAVPRNIATAYACAAH